MSNQNEFVINPHDNHKRSMYHIKENLKTQNELILRSGVKGSYVATRVVENLVRFNYVSLGDVKTETRINNGKRQVSLIVKVIKTSEFDKLYEENVAKRKEMMAEKEKKKEEKEVVETKTQ